MIITDGKIWHKWQIWQKWKKRHFLLIQWCIYKLRSSLAVLANFSIFYVFLFIYPHRYICYVSRFCHIGFCKWTALAKVCTREQRANNLFPLPFKNALNWNLERMMWAKLFCHVVPFLPLISAGFIDFCPLGVDRANYSPPKLRHSWGNIRTWFS